jgi:hypothetical protein
MQQSWPSKAVQDSEVYGSVVRVLLNCVDWMSPPSLPPLLDARVDMAVRKREQQVSRYPKTSTRAGAAQPTWLHNFQQLSCNICHLYRCQHFGCSNPKGYILIVVLCLQFKLCRS